MKDFFISYTQADKAWAEWIAWVLEEAGYSVVLQAWDFRPGSNFVHSMQQALVESRQTLAVLTDAYMQSGFGGAEWAAGVAQDPTGLLRQVVPVRVVPCEPPGLMRAITYIDLVGIQEADARQALLDGLGNRRMKPIAAPPFPGSPRPRTAPSHPSFPAAQPPRATSASKAPYLPALRQKVTDLDVRQFIRASFEDIQRSFAQWLEELQHSNGRVQTDLRVLNPETFIAGVYFDGTLRCCAKVWLTTMWGAQQQIAYYEGRGFDLEHGNACNDVLRAENSPDGLHLNASMSMSVHLGPPPLSFDPHRMTSAQAAEYLWRRFLWRLRE